MKHILIIFSILLLSCARSMDVQNNFDLGNNCFFDPGILSNVCKKNDTYFLKWEK